MSLTRVQLLWIYQRATGDNPWHPLLRDDSDRDGIADEMRRVIAAPTEEDAVNIIAWWENDATDGPGSTLRTVRKARHIAANLPTTVRGAEGGGVGCGERAS